MPQTIAFTSCFDAKKDKNQDIWNSIREKKPDVLLLLGDTIYTDWGNLGWLRNEPDQVFLNTLYDCYSSQWGVESFRNLVRSVSKIGITWDDHDFAWNNCRGKGTQEKYAVPENKRRISRGLFLQFKNVIQNYQATEIYPAKPQLDSILLTPDTGIYDAFEIDNVSIVMLDGRTFREDPNKQVTTSMHSRDQLQKLLDVSRTLTNQVLVIGSGSVLVEPSGFFARIWRFVKKIFGKYAGESWDNFIDYNWLLQELSCHKVIVLTGDIHNNNGPIPHPKINPKLYEVTSSGAARPGFWGGKSGNFGLLTINDQQTTVELFTDNGRLEKEQILSWNDQAVAGIKYGGISNASCAVALDNNHFVVASDEKNKLCIYSKDNLNLPTNTISLKEVFNPEISDGDHDEIDLEGAANIGNTYFWIGSHSTDKKGNPQSTRHRLFAMSISNIDGDFVAQRIGDIYTKLIEHLIVDPRFSKYELNNAKDIEPKKIGGLNIEGLASTLNKELLIGFRNPLVGGNTKNNRLVNGKAILALLENPLAVIQNGVDAQFGEPIELDLGGLGIRDITFRKDNQYLIVAGPYHDNSNNLEKTKLYLWDSKSNVLEHLSSIDLQDLNIEAAFFYPGNDEFVQLLSDDGKDGFQSLWVKL